MASAPPTRPAGPISAGLAGLSRSLPGLAPTFLIVALLACVLVPLPTALVDLLLSVSLAGAVLLLVASLGIGRTTEFLSFPSLLLLVTLYRLALNVSTTRLILSQADAGRVIDAFAGFVVRGDLIVGGVMFVIITIVQYVVIARGAERVAEVGARFALDGLPGSQAAIDADLRAGVISPREAARRREELQERSNFYGSMDGAVRFVKGDAIAGLAITGVNLLGGLAIGSVRMGYGWQESLEIYGRLTIGDGLLAQIPALLVSLAAGVLVARVDRRVDPKRDPMPWLDPAMLFVPAALLIALAVVPQMPTLAFATTAAALVTGALLLAGRRALQTRHRRALQRSEGIRVGLSDDDAPDRAGVERALAEVRLQCSAALGIDVPAIRLAAGAAATPGTVQIGFGDRAEVRRPLPDGDPDDAVVLATFRAIMEQAPALVDLQALDAELDEVRATHPVVVTQALKAVELTDLLAIVRAFLRERIPRPPLSDILGAVAESRRFADASERGRFPEIVRQALASGWVHDVLDGVRRVGTPRFVRPLPDVEEDLLSRAVASEDTMTLALTERQRRAGRLALRQAESGDEAEDADAPPAQPIVVVTTPRARRCVAALVAGAVPHIPVLSTAELAGAGVRLDGEAVVWLDALDVD